MKAFTPLILATVLFYGFKQAPAPAQQGTTPPAAVRDVGANADGALSDASFVFVESPLSGDRVSPGFPVTGASRTFESTVNWRLKAADGSEMATNGTLNTVGALGVDVTNVAGFDIAVSTGTAYASLVVKNGKRKNLCASLFTIDLATGAATDLGKIGGPWPLTSLTALGQLAD
jgi:hypothetical protein